MELPKIKQEQEPKGKRSYRWNVYGNYVGYIGTRRWRTFAKEQDAIDWVTPNKTDLLNESSQRYKKEWASIRRNNLK